MQVRVLVSYLGVEPGTVVEMADGEAAERIASGEVEAVGTPPAKRRRTATVERETR